MVPNAVAVSLHHGDWNVVVASLLFHVETVKYPAKISLYSGSGDHCMVHDRPGSTQGVSP